MAALKTLQHLRQTAIQQSAGKADLQLACLPLRHLTGLAHGGPSLRQQGAGGGHKGLPGGCELHAPAVAGEQLRADRGFKLLDVERERRLGNRQPLGRAAKVQLFGQGQEIAQVTEFHKFKFYIAGY